MRFRRSFRLAGIVLFALLGSSCAQVYGNYFAPTVAVVNGEKVPETDISRQLRAARSDPQFEGLFKGKDFAANRREFERQVLTQLIQRLAIAQAATRLGVTVKASEIEERLEQVKIQLGDEKKLAEFLAQQHLTVEQAKEFLRRQLLINKVQQVVGKDSPASEDRIRQYYDQHKSDFDAEIKIAHILVCKNFESQALTCTITPEDEALAQSIAGKARAGEDFAALAARYSKDSESAQKGGELGWFSPGNRSPFEQAASELTTPGQISNPVQSESGWHVIKLLIKGRPLEEAKEEIQQLLLTPVRQEAYQAFVRSALKRAKVRIYPKYGRFDSSTFQVVARGDQR